MRELTRALVLQAITLLVGSVQAMGQCCGDCNLNGQVTVDELVTAVNRALTGCRDDQVCAAVPDCGNGVLEAGEQCDFGTLNGATCVSLGFASGTLQCGPFCVIDTSGCQAAATRTPTPHPTSTPTSTPLSLVDNGNGTITDPNTGLMWEKKSLDGSIHDSGKYYTWSATGSAADGTVYTEFIATLNTPPCFAGHCDWRLPSSGGEPAGSSGEAAELESVLLPDEGCVPFDKCVLPIFDTDCAFPCSVTSCSCTFPGPYWSSTTLSNNGSNAWMIDFEDGNLYAVPKTAGVGYARAVRNAP